MKLKNMSELIEISDNLSQADGKVLVVDDDELILQLIKKNLNLRNYEVLTASNGQDAIQIVEQNNDIDIVILDVMMPVMTGYDVAIKLREKYSLFELPIIFLTAKDQLSDVLKAFGLGANDFIIKPFKNEELFARTKTFVTIRKLAFSNSDLKAAIELKNQFINMTIHDLKNPLSVIKGVLDLLKMEMKLNNEQEELYDLVYSSTNLMLKLVDELLHAAMIDSGKISLNIEYLEMNSVAQESIYKFKKQAENKGQKIVFEPDNNCDTSINADKLRLHEIMDNLISNAIKYSPYDAEIFVTISHHVIKEEIVYIRFTVTDKGPGLSAKDLKKIFGTFQKLSAKPTGGESSSGLGLSIVKQLVELHDGKIWVESELGVGSSFVFEIPAADQNQIAVLDDI
jgi:signal transduction histidine kinase